MDKTQKNPSENSKDYNSCAFPNVFITQKPFAS